MATPADRMHADVVRQQVQRAVAGGCDGDSRLGWPTLWDSPTVPNRLTGARVALHPAEPAQHPDALAVGLDRPVRGVADRHDHSGGAELG